MVNRRCDDNIDSGLTDDGVKLGESVIYQRLVNLMKRYLIK